MNECVVFVVEVGCNTSQEGHGSYDGERKIDRRGNAPKEKETTYDNHFTMLDFTAATE